MNIRGLADRLGIGYWLARDLMHSTEPPVNFPSRIIGRTPLVDEEEYKVWHENLPANEPIPTRKHGTPKFHSMTRKPQRHKMHLEVMSGADFRRTVMGK